MKKLFILFTVYLFAFGACKKDPPTLKTFGYIDREFIFSKEAKMSSEAILAQDLTKNENILKNGAVILFKTNTGNYGKIQIVDIGSVTQNYLMKFNLILYDGSGQELLNKPSTELPGTWLYDFDTAKAINDATGDINWNTGADPNYYSIIPANGAKLYLYSN